MYCNGLNNLWMFPRYFQSLVGRLFHSSSYRTAARDNYIRSHLSITRKVKLHLVETPLINFLSQRETRHSVALVDMFIRYIRARTHFCSTLYVATSSNSPTTSCRRWAASYVLHSVWRRHSSDTESDDMSSVILSGAEGNLMSVPFWTRSGEVGNDVVIT